MKVKLRVQQSVWDLPNNELLYNEEDESDDEVQMCSAKLQNCFCSIIYFG